MERSALSNGRRTSPLTNKEYILPRATAADMADAQETCGKEATDLGNGRKHTTRANGLLDAHPPAPPAATSMKHPTRLVSSWRR